MFILLASPFLMAAKIYKWTDKNGKVHFTQTPGPSQQHDKIYRNTTKTKKPKKTLLGNWYGVSSGLKYKLRFYDNNFYFNLIENRHGGAFIGQGFFEYTDNTLKLKYINSQNAVIPGGTIEYYNIMDFSIAQLSMRSQNNKRYHFIKNLQHNPLQSKYARILYGVWLNQKNGEILELTQSSFYKFDKGQYDNSKWLSSYRGNWILRDKTIEFQYTGESKNTDKIGLIEQLEVVYSDEIMVINKKNSTQKDEYKKQLLGGSLLK